jgi:hypothetical protein
VTPQKRKVSPKKPSTRKKTCANKPQLEATLMDDDISLVHRAMEDASRTYCRDMERRRRSYMEELREN